MAATPGLTALAPERTAEDLDEIQTVTGNRSAADLGSATRGLNASDARAATDANPADRAVSAQIARAVLTQLADGQRSLSLRLTPPELGTVRVQIVEHQGGLQIRLSAEDDGVRAAIERALPALRQELRQADAPVAELSLTDHQQSLLHDQARDGGEGRNGERRGRGASTFSLDADGSIDTESTPHRRPALGGRIGPSAVDARA